MGHFCSECSIPPPEGVRGWVHGYGGVGLWEAGPGCATVVRAAKTTIYD